MINSPCTHDKWFSADIKQKSREVRHILLTKLAGRR